MEAGLSEIMKQGVMTLHLESSACESHFAYLIKANGSLRICLDPRF